MRRRLFEAGLIVLAWLALKALPDPAAIAYWNDSADHRLKFPAFPDFGVGAYIVLPSLAFLFLRYLIYLGGQFVHVDSLDRSRLPSLLQAPLGGADYFLYPLFFVCWKMRRAAMVVLAFAGLNVGWWILADISWWRAPAAYARCFFFCNVALLSWIASATQFILEWNLFAGRQWPLGRWPASAIISLALSLVVWSLSLFCYYFAASGQWILAAVFSALFFPAFGALAFACARDTYGAAMSILWSRYAKAQPS